MDDYNLNVLSEAKNEYSSRLINILSPLILQGIKSIFNEALDLCVQNEESDKYLMTFQNFLSRVPRWNTNIIMEETTRIIKESKCNYLEDLLTCVHITQVKILTSIRVSNHQKKIDIDIPSINDFIHNVYINFARKLYSNIYLFEKDIMPLDYQKNMRECDILSRESILNVIRESMPIENILRAYMDETVHEEIIEETLEKQVGNEEAEDMLEETKKNLEKSSETTINKIDDEINIETPELKKNTDQTVQAKEDQAKADQAKEDQAKADQAKADQAKADQAKADQAKAEKIAEQTIKELDESVKNEIKVESEKNVENEIKNNDKLFSNFEKNTEIRKPEKKTVISFNDNDNVLDMGTNKSSMVHAPKTEERLEEISRKANEKRKEEEEDDFDDDFDDGPLKISDENITLDIADLQDISPTKKMNKETLLGDIETLY
jgi:hypothetical protein